MAIAKLGANVEGRRVDMAITFDADHPEDVIAFMKGASTEEQLGKFLDRYAVEATALMLDGFEDGDE
jgi:hypothetical protein